MSLPAHERVLRRIDASDPTACWIWPGAVAGKGYGVVGNSRPGSGQSYVHRVMYEAFVAQIPKGLVIDHLCRRPGCCNPAHLEPVTPGENVMRGESHIAKNPYKKECPQGHPYDANNTYHYKGARQCRKCRDRHRAAWRARSKAGEPTSSFSPTPAETP